MARAQRSACRALSRPNSKRIDVTRPEFDRVIDRLNESGRILNDPRHNLDMLFAQIAQIQAALGEVRRAVATAQAGRRRL